MSVSLEVDITRVPDPKHFKTDADPESDIRALRIQIRTRPLQFFECLESTCLANFLMDTKTCITCLNLNELMC